MPELPEVETVRRGLMKTVVGKTIQKASVTWPRIVQDPLGREHFETQMVGQTLEKVERQGKFLFFYWSVDGWISHLRMEGKWFVVPHETPINPHTHAVFELTDGTDLRYQDVRKFGRIQRVARENMPQAIAKLQLGVEPKDLTSIYLKDRLQRTKRPLKAVLLDQHVIAGVGNIYCDEALWRARLHPERVANSLSSLEIDRLVTAVQAVIQAGIAAGGTTIRTYQNSFGEAGHFQEQLAVYQREGEACLRCGHAIEKIRVSQRGTHLCPACQTLTVDQTLLVGLTGGIAAGKSTVSQYLREQGVPVIDFDQLVHQLQQPHTETLQALVATFGEAILTPAGAIDRQRLAGLVFNNATQLETLNQVMRPFIIAALQTALATYQGAQAPLVVLDIPLLFEQGYDWWCDRIVVVNVPEDLQLTRLMQRDHLDRNQAKQRLTNQWPLAKKVKRADDVIDNSGDYTATYRQVAQWLTTLPQY